MFPINIRPLDLAGGYNLRLTRTKAYDLFEATKKKLLGITPKYLIKILFA